MKSEKTAKWTVMVYFAGDNNLNEEMIWALKDIHAATPLKNVKVVALLDAGGPAADFLINPANANTKSVKVSDAARDRMILGRMDEVRIEAAGEKAPTSLEPVSAVLQKFIIDNISTERDRRYMLILSGHGGGAVGEFLTSDKRIFGLSIPALKTVLRRAQRKLPKGKLKFDVLGLDSCQMSMAEIAFQVRGQVDFMVGAESFEPNTGWPYARVLGLLKKKGNLNNPGKLVRNIVNEHIGYYLDYAASDSSTDAAALNLTNTDALTMALLKFTSALGVSRAEKKQRQASQKPAKTVSFGIRGGVPEHEFIQMEESVGRSRLKDKRLLEAIILAHWEAQSYRNGQYTDLWDFCGCLIQRLENLGSYQDVVNSCNDIKNAIAPQAKGTGGLVHHAAYSGAAFQHSHGLSIFFPWANLTDAAGTSDLDHYQLLDFARATAWDEFLRLYLVATQRPVRAEAQPTALHTSLLNRRTGLFTGKPGAKDSDLGTGSKDSDLGTGSKDSDLGTGSKGQLMSSRIPHRTNPPIEWRESELD